MYDVYSCGFDGVIVRPKRVHKQNIIIFAKDFACQGSPEDSRKTNSRASRGTFGSRWGQVWVSLGLVWVSVGDFG